MSGLSPLTCGRSKLCLTTRGTVSACGSVHFADSRVTILNTMNVLPVGGLVHRSCVGGALR